mmetsp:Transcript_30261/g.100296  ORF Transcript_30261/g.100296 Transcript_30261/m.100296 type:complete len:281 (+) Transcript_30261:328-1170(+)
MLVAKWLDCEAPAAPRPVASWPQTQGCAPGPPRWRALARWRGWPCNHLPRPQARTKAAALWARSWSLWLSPSLTLVTADGPNPSPPETCSAARAGPRCEQRLEVHRRLPERLRHRCPGRSGAEEGAAGARRGSCSSAAACSLRRCSMCSHRSAAAFASLLRMRVEVLRAAEVAAAPCALHLPPADHQFAAKLPVQVPSGPAATASPHQTAPAEASRRHRPPRRHRDWHRAGPSGGPARSGRRHCRCLESGGRRGGGGEGRTPSRACPLHSPGPPGPARGS